MKIVVQRVRSAQVDVKGKTISNIGIGLLILAGVHVEDNLDDLQWLAHKVVQLRIFPNEEGDFDKSIKDINGDILVVSQFTLYASTRKGNRPSFISAARPEKAEPFMEKWLEMLQAELGKNVYYGIFGADMQVSLMNDGPVTIVMDSKNRE